ncbi:MAG TPA: helix-turn-helix domain-containing protein [Polyangiaceae bacterium]|nr:helix-turn-helix domain-containing protein [Polyangiaceae bacterium]
MAYVHETEVGRYRVTDGGCRGVRRLKDGTPALSAEELARLELRAAITVLHDVDHVGGAELRFARKAMGLRQVDLAEHLGVTGETVSRWENDAESFTRAAQLAVLALLCEVEKHGELRRPIVVAGGKARVLKVAG